MGWTAAFRRASVVPWLDWMEARIHAMAVQDGFPSGARLICMRLFASGWVLSFAGRDGSAGSPRRPGRTDAEGGFGKPLIGSQKL
jgi:hypothetical protein